MKVSFKRTIYFILIFSFFYALYLECLAPDTTLIDSPEITLASFYLGNAHSPGYPGIMLFFKLSSFLPIGNIAYRTNWLSALSGALAVGVFFLILLNFKFTHFASIIGSFLWGLSLTFWSQSVATEVYTSAILILMITIYLLLKFKKSDSIKYLLGSTFLLGLSSGFHQMIYFTLPALLFLVYRELWKILNIKVLAILLLFFILGLSIQVYLPIRAINKPVYSWEKPYNLKNFFNLVSTKTFKSQRLVRSLKALLGVLKKYKDFYKVEFGILGAFLIPVGIYFIYKKDFHIFLFSVLLWGVDFIIGIILFNIPENWYFFLNVFFLPGFISMAIWLSALSEYVSKSLPHLGAIAFSLLVIVNLIFGYVKNDKSNCYLISDWSKMILMELPENSVLFVERDQIFPLFYYQLIERYRLDVCIIHWMTALTPFNWQIEDLKDNYRNLKFPTIKFGQINNIEKAFCTYLRSFLSLNRSPVFATFSTTCGKDVKIKIANLVYRFSLNKQEKGSRNLWLNIKLRDTRVNIAHHDEAEEEIVNYYKNLIMENLLKTKDPKLKEKLLKKWIEINPSIKNVLGG